MGKAEPRFDIDPELLEQARRIGVDVAGLSESSLRLHLQRIDPAGAEGRAKRWAEENADAIRLHNDFVQKNGPFGAEWRRW